MTVIALITARSWGSRLWGNGGGRADTRDIVFKSCSCSILAISPWWEAVETPDTAADLTAVALVWWGRSLRCCRPLCGQFWKSGSCIRHLCPAGEPGAHRVGCFFSYPLLSSMIVGWWPACFLALVLYRTGNRKSACARAPCVACRVKRAMMTRP